MNKKIKNIDNSSIIADELVSINEAKYTGNQLYFDPVDGQLKVVKKKDEKPSADSRVLDQIAEDGFLISNQKNNLNNL